MCGGARAVCTWIVSRIRVCSFFFQAEDGIRDIGVTGVQTCALPISRGAAILAAAERGLPVFEYAPTRIKQATVGRGNADKNQVAFMIRALLGLTETPTADAADALAIGLTHLRAQEAARLECRRARRYEWPRIVHSLARKSRVRG